MPHSIPPVILAATDLHDGALELAVALAKATNGSLHVVHAHDISFPRSDRGRDMVTVQQETRVKRVALNELVERVVPSEIEVMSCRVREGLPATLILNEAESVEADIIVLGTHRRRPVADKLVGSTAERVLREVKIPCILANGELRTPIRRILVPADLLGTSMAALEEALLWGARLADGGNAIVEVAHVLDAKSPADESWSASDAGMDLRQAVRSICEKSSSQVSTEVTVLSGADPTLELLDQARSNDAQMIVMGTNSDSVLVRALIGSVSSAMIRNSDLPVMLVPFRAQRSKISDAERLHAQFAEPPVRA